MKVLILGGDGYLGWPCSLSFACRGWEVFIVDSLIKRQWEAEMGVSPLVPIPPLQDRIRLLPETEGRIRARVCDISRNRSLLYHIFDEFRPDAVVHFAEQPSAPYSMRDAEAAVETQRNNVLGTLNLIHAVTHHNPDCHIVKLGTMGEYGTPNIDIEEGWLEVTHNGRQDRVLYPKRPGSWYHLSKVHDSANLEFACRNWDLRVTDLNQGVVYGLWGRDEWNRTSFHYDAVFGTVINRFVTQAVCGVPLTVYAPGHQIRGFIDIRDTIQCIRLAIQKPASRGEFRVMNQMTQQFSIRELALRVKELLGAEMRLVPNPRTEAPEHYYNPVHTKLEELGLIPNLLTNQEITRMARLVRAHKDRVNKALIQPEILWRQKI